MCFPNKLKIKWVRFLLLFREYSININYFNQRHIKPFVTKWKWYNHSVLLISDFKTINVCWQKNHKCFKRSLCVYIYNWNQACYAFSQTKKRRRNQACWLQNHKFQVGHIRINSSQKTPMFWFATSCHVTQLLPYMIEWLLVADNDYQMRNSLDFM